MAKTIAAAIVGSVLALPASAFDLQGHRGARGLAPENTLEAFRTALSIGVTTLELDLAMTSDGVLVVSHDSRLNPDHTRGPDGKFLDAEGPAIRSLTLAQVQRYDVGRLKPGTALAATKLTPTSGAGTADPETFAAATVQAVREAGLTARVSIQSFDWRTLAILRRIAPEIERVCLSIDGGDGDTLQRGQPGPSPWTAGLDIDDFAGSTPRLVVAAGCSVWSPNYRNLTAPSLAEAKGLGLKVIPWTVNERADLERVLRMGVAGMITDYPNRLRAVMAENDVPLPPPVPAP
ncbi:MAG TPA: glycerophosphodiester phosphodiesterase family protein [Xanthobacteraceae bacterium]|jgi:glycerophosphoryl diester phosphodiesterase|nr:glycerophosphodiester phosphodiesterase family protein [Xanthobacteraceae bacterium]